MTAQFAVAPHRKPFVSTRADTLKFTEEEIPHIQREEDDNRMDYLQNATDCVFPAKRPGVRCQVPFERSFVMLTNYCPRAGGRHGVAIWR